MAAAARQESHEQAKCLSSNLQARWRDAAHGKLLRCNGREWPKSRWGPERADKQPRRKPSGSGQQPPTADPPWAAPNFPQCATFRTWARHDGRRTHNCRKCRSPNHCAIDQQARWSLEHDRGKHHGYRVHCIDVDGGTDRGKPRTISKNLGMAFRSIRTTCGFSGMGASRQTSAELRLCQWTAASSPLPGGAANNWPITEKRKCAHLS
jgi:hypothetical protein